MIHTLKTSLLKQQPQLLFIPSPPLINSNKLPTTTTLRFVQATHKSTQHQQQQSMDQSQTTQDQHNKEEHEELVDQQKSATATEDVMSHSFGQGYKTRSDEEGFGGIYGCNNNLSEEEEEKEDVNILNSEYDKSQGSEVKEKEKARNQMEASS